MAQPRLLVPIVLDALSLDERRVASLDLPAVDVVWVAESVREAREVLAGLPFPAIVVDVSKPLVDASTARERLESAGAAAFTVLVSAHDVPGAERISGTLGEGAFLCRSTRIRELPKLLSEISDAWR
jgi:hypothetical protein